MTPLGEGSLPYRADRQEEALRAAGIDGAHITPIAPSLEDVFLAVMSGAKVGKAA